MLCPVSEVVLGEGGDLDPVLLVGLGGDRLHRVLQFLSDGDTLCPPAARYTGTATRNPAIL